MTLARIQGLLFILFGIVSSYDSWRITTTVRPTGNFDAIGPDRYLLLLSFIMMLVGLLLVLRPPLQTGNVSVRNLFQWPPAHYLTVIAIMVLFVWVMPYIGFAFACLAFFLAMYWLLGNWSWPRIVLYTVITTAFIYVVFIYLSDMSLPKSPLGI
jgi:hypothetical protein